MKLKESLKHILTKKELELLPSSFDIVGDILIFADFPAGLAKKEKKIGDTILSLYKNVSVVCKKTKKYSGKYRLPSLKIIAGARRKETLHKENNISIKLNVERVYFSPRTSTERKRINTLIKSEKILVMFSGSGVYPINISKNSPAREIMGIEINPIAHKYALDNLKLNKIDNVKLFLGDVNALLPKIRTKFDRILMPLPKGAEDYLILALSKLKKKGIVHFYTFLNELEINIPFVKKYFKFACKKFKILNIQKCGQFSPRVFRVCIDMQVL
ncbi:MAG: class I SAM-dependent methyltransferase family protein [Nanoarchaeota archaeon]